MFQPKPFARFERIVIEPVRFTFTQRDSGPDKSIGFQRDLLHTCDDTDQLNSPIFFLKCKLKTLYKDTETQIHGMDGYESADTVVAEPRLRESDESDESAADSEMEESNDECGDCSDAEDVVQCVACYRTFCRQHWSNWTVVDGHEREREACVASV